MNQEKLNLARKNLTVTNSTMYKKEKLEDNFDPEIFDFVITLNALDFYTTSSCQGHIDEIDFLPYIIINDKDDHDFVPDDINILKNTTDKEIVDEYKRTLKRKKRLLDYLDEFYQKRNTPMRYRLIIVNVSFCTTAIYSNLSWMFHIIKDEKEREKLNKIALKEVHDFSDFLKTKL